LISRFRLADHGQKTYKVYYSLIDRLGYFVDVHDVIFKLGKDMPVMDSVRLALQIFEKRKDYGYINASRSAFEGVGYRYEMGYPYTPPFAKSLSSSTRSTESMAQADAWMKHCIENHEGCKPATQHSSFIPRRLIEIKRNGTGGLQICLQERHEKSTPVSYATLSHCWDSQMPFKLLQDNLATCKQEIPLEKISKVFQDAVWVVARTNIDFIWIDSLCKTK
jgi:hypothetical protein